MYVTTKDTFYHKEHTLQNDLRISPLVDILSVGMVEFRVS